jgi:hypothetical protein
MAKSVADPVLVMSDFVAVPPLVIALYVLALAAPVSSQFFELSAATVATIVVAAVAAGLAIAGLAFTESRFILGPFGSGSRAGAEGEFP